MRLSSLLVFISIALPLAVGAEENDICGKANDAPSAVKPTELCASGATPTEVQGDGPWTWQCQKDGKTDVCGANKSSQEDKFSSLGFGLGLGHNFLRDTNIGKAEVDGGLIRVTESTKGINAIWLEAHAFPWKNEKRGMGWGPFVATQFASDGKLLNGFALGMMLGLKHFPLDYLADNSALNIGIGWSSSTIQRLVDGYSPNTAPPAGDSSVRLRDTTTNGILLLVSFNFYSVTPQALKDAPPGTKVQQQPAPTR